jgi:pimeloyl-ACP methyl ester carboxylesterase
MTVTVRRSYVDGRHGQMHVRIAGSATADKPPLLCIHMSPMTGRVFERFLGEMGDDRLAIAFDTPGFGLSDPPPAPPFIEDYAKDLLAGLDALGVTGAFDVMGYHTGSMTSVALSLLAPSRVRRILMVSAPVIYEDERKQFKTYYAHRAPQADGSHLVKRWQGFVYHHLRPGVMLEEVSDVFRDALMGGNIEWWGHHAAFEHDLAANLVQVSKPVLIFNPGDDLDLQTRRAVGMAKNSQIIELPAWGHGFLDHHTRDAAQLARAFFDAADGAEFSAIAVPESARGQRYPERVGSFPPAA